MQGSTFVSLAGEHAHHRVLEDLPEVVVVVGGVVVGGGGEASKLLPVGDEHEDSLQQSTRQSQHSAPPPAFIRTSVCRVVSVRFQSVSARWNQ